MSHAAKVLESAAAASEVPWWGVSVVAGGFTIAGVVATQILALLHERARRQRDFRREWETTLRGQYRRFADEVQKQVDSHYEGSDAVNDGLIEAYEALLFTAPNDVVEVARRAMDHAVYISSNADQVTNGELLRLSNYRSEFINVTRRTIGLPPLR